MSINKNDKLYIACAGAGKTTFIIEEALKIKDKKVLITTFTNENEDNIREKFYKINRGIPGNIQIRSWYEFLLKECFKPYLRAFFTTDIRIDGFVLVTDLSGKYKANLAIRHYMNEDNMVYSDKLSKLMFQKEEVKKCVMNRLSKMYDIILVDEVQDMASWDLELIKEIHNSNIKLIMVGDMLQRTYVTTKEKKNIKNKKPLNIQEYILNKKIISIDIDIEKLKKTHRCSQRVCDYVNQKFSIKIEICDCCDRKDTEKCNVFFVNSDEVEEKLKIGNTMQILYNKNSKYNNNYQAINIGKSKGLEYDNVVIYPSSTMQNFLKNDQDLKEGEKAKLYVALTRARKNVYIVDN